MLKFTTTDPISKTWEIFDPGLPGQFTKGVFEADIKFGNESHSIGLNGHSAGDLWDINWGPYAIFNQCREYPGESTPRIILFGQCPIGVGMIAKRVEAVVRFQNARFLRWREVSWSTRHITRALSAQKEIGASRIGFVSPPF